MIQIRENIIPKDLQDYLEKIATTEMPYFYYENISGYNGDVYDRSEEHTSELQSLAD